MAGGTGVSWYHGGNYPHGDGDCEDFTQRSELFRFTRHALKFLRDNSIPIQRMQNRQDLLVDATDRRCLADPGSIYVLQLDRGGDSAVLRLNDTPASDQFSTLWFDPVEGVMRSGSITTVHGGSEAEIGSPPYAPRRDWIVLIRREQEKDETP